jgi:phenylalanine-4-hydroxylase
MKQQYEKYTHEDLKVWSILFNRQSQNLQDKACLDYLKALKKMESCLNANEMPNFKKINNWFLNETGWQIECVSGLIPVDAFFMLLADKKFPSSTWLRTMDKLDYLEEPDMFHDIFGHIPLLSQPVYSEFIHKFGILGKAVINNEQKLLMLQRLYWFTIEFGLIDDLDKRKIYGAGLLSSFGEASYSLSSSLIERIQFDINAIIATPFCTSEMQNTYFVISNFEQLTQAVFQLAQEWIATPIE